MKFIVKNLFRCDLASFAVKCETRRHWCATKIESDNCSMAISYWSDFPVFSFKLYVNNNQINVLPVSIHVNTIWAYLNVYVNRPQDMPTCFTEYNIHSCLIMCTVHIFRRKKYRFHDPIILEMLSCILHCCSFRYVRSVIPAWQQLYLDIDQ